MADEKNQRTGHPGPTFPQLVFDLLLALPEDAKQSKEYEAVAKAIDDMGGSFEPCPPEASPEAEDPLTSSERAGMNPAAAGLCCAVRRGTGGGVVCDRPVHHTGDHCESGSTLGPWPAKPRPTHPTPACTRCGAPYDANGACSRKEQGCQGGRGEWPGPRTTNPELVGGMQASTGMHCYVCLQEILTETPYQVDAPGVRRHEGCARMDKPAPDDRVMTPAEMKAEIAELAFQLGAGLEKTEKDTNRPSYWRGFRDGSRIGSERASKLRACTDYASPPIQIQCTPDATDLENTLAIGRELVALRKVGETAEMVFNAWNEGRSHVNKMMNMGTAVQAWRRACSETARQDETRNTKERGSP